jgi:hypothetical protein
VTNRSREIIDRTDRFLACLLTGFYYIFVNVLDSYLLIPVLRLIHNAMKITLHLIAVVGFLLASRPSSFSQTIDIAWPTGPGTMSWTTTIVLSNGNIVVSDKEYDEGVKSNIGIVYLFDGNTKKLISTLKGSTANDYVGSSLYALPNGNFVVVSNQWDNQSVANVGAVTWVNGVTGLSGVVSTANSLIGNTMSDGVGSGGLTVLPNGNYLVKSNSFKPAGIVGTGAVTWCNGNTGLVGTINTLNSLVGNGLGESISSFDILVLSNGNYVVPCYSWDSPAAQNVGAVIWGNGMIGVSGVISTSNAFTGSHAEDRVGYGYGGLVKLANGNYVVGIPEWDNGNVQNAGAATFCEGSVGIVGTVSPANSLVGTEANHRVGSIVVALTNGNYVVNSAAWKNVALGAYGAATWGNGTTGITGPVTEANSLCGSNPGDFTGAITPLTNGNYVVNNFMWARDGIPGAGAITWGDGNTGVTGRISISNSLVGRDTMDNVGIREVKALANGHYVVPSPFWSNNGKWAVGAVTWCNGLTGQTGEVTEFNSFVGTAENESVSNVTITPLTNGNYVIQSSFTEVNGIDRAGAITWADGSKEFVGTLGASNSLFGSHAVDLIGRTVRPLSNGNYLLISDIWDNGNINDAGAVTWASGTSAITGEVNSSNSLVGTTAGSSVGKYGTVETLPDGNYLVKTVWNNIGAITWGNGAAGTFGEVNDCNSYVGAGNGVYNETYEYLVTINPAKNVVRLVYNTGGPQLARSQDVTSAEINPTETASFMSGAGCRSIATVASQGASPVTGNVVARAWVETTVPKFHGDPFVARHYEITPAQNAANATGRVTLYFSQGEFIAFNAAPGSTLDLPIDGNDATGKANLRIGKYSGESSDGSGLPGSYPSIVSTIIDPDDNDIVWNDTFKRWEVTFDTGGFSGFVVQTSTVPLPVRLVSFEAKAEERKVMLHWEIADAIGFSHFEVERSQNGKQFANVGHVVFEEGKYMYEFRDNSWPDGSAQTYYRLKMLDKDGSYAYSRIVDVELAVDADFGPIYAYPNPVAERITIPVKSLEGKKGVAKLVSADGKILLTREISVSNDQIELDLKGVNMPSGILVLSIQVDGTSRYFRLVKKH